MKQRGIMIQVMLLLVFMLGIIAISGCSNKTDKETKDGQSGNKELDVAVFEGGFGRDFWDALAANFEKDYPGTKINITANPKIGEMIRPKIINGNPPDLVYLNQTDPSGVTQGLIKEHGLTDLTDVFESKALNEDIPLKDKILPGMLETSFASPYDDGKIYIAPYNYNVNGLWYNKTLFEENNIQPPATWKEFFALNNVAKEHDRALFTYQGTVPGYLAEIFIPAINDLGGQEALDQFFGYEPEFWKSDVAKEVLGIFKTIAEEENMLMNGTVALNHTQAQTAFMQGKAMFITNGSWFETEMKDAPREEGFEFGFLGIPAFEKGDPISAQVAIEQIYIPKEADNKKLAKKFLKYMYTDKGVILNGKKAKGVMAVKGAVDLVKDYITPSSYNTYKAVEEGMTPVTSDWKPLPKGTNIMPQDILFNQAASVMNGEMTIDEWADKMYEVYSQVQESMKE
ncbi:carbohydrate ABC transporter substrate-binding protein [Virgibacillus necropolis]|uniref:carbohydrate ABC transporter substrate-binding protein n=1 Tax=Virgibacillus necropolis TaxID=163877 RepID=UPI003850D737